MTSVTNNPLSVHLSPGPPPQVWDPLHILNLSSWYSPQADSSCSLSRLTNSSSVLSLLGQNLGATLDSSLFLAPQILFIHKPYWLYLQKMSRSDLITCFHSHLSSRGWNKELPPSRQSPCVVSGNKPTSLDLVGVPWDQCWGVTGVHCFLYFIYSLRYW